MSTGTLIEQDVPAPAGDHGGRPRKVATPWAATGSHPLPIAAWSEGTLTRANEIETLADWAVDVDQSLDRPAWTPAAARAFRRAIARHLAAARKAADPWSVAERGDHDIIGRVSFCRDRRTGARIERAISSLDAAEADLLQLAPAEYVVGQLPSIVNHVSRHLQPTDPRRIEIDCIAKRVGIAALAVRAEHGARPGERAAIVNAERGVIVSAVRGASSAALREQTRVRSFRNVVLATMAGMVLVAVGLVVLGAIQPTAVPVCFAPEEGDQVTIVCPTHQSGPLVPIRGSQVSATAIDDAIARTAGRADIAVVAVIGATAAAVAAAAAIRGIRGSSEPYGVPIALAVLKLPTGAVTAILGLVLMRGGFVPGLSALDTSGQILAWAAIFGYAQQLFTRLVDQQAHAVLDGVRSGDKGTDARHSA